MRWILEKGEGEDLEIHFYVVPFRGGGGLALDLKYLEESPALSRKSFSKESGFLHEGGVW